MKKYTLLILFGLLSHTISAQKIEWMVEPSLEYDEIYSFSKGMAIVEKNDKVGFIDKTGKEIIPVIYKSTGGCSEGMVRVKKDGKWGFIDKTGKEVIPFIYDRVYNNFSEGMVAVQKDGKYGYIDKTGKTIIPFIYDNAREFSEGMAAVEKDGKYGFIDKTGREVIPFIYDNAIKFSEGMAMVKKDYRLWGFIDKTGREVVPFIYDNAWYFSEGMANVNKNGKDGFVDKTGKEIIPLIYDYAIEFSEGMARVKKDGKYSFIDKTGREVVPFIYDDAADDFSEGMAAVKKDGKWGFIDKTGREVVPFIYDDAADFSEGTAKVRKNDKYGFIDKAGREIVPLIYDAVAWFFSEGLAAVKINGKWGIIKNPLLKAKEDESNTISQNIQLIWLSPNPDETNNKTYDNPNLTIKLKAFGSTELQKSDFKVYINNQLQTAKSGEVALKSTTFTQRISLKEGKNEILVKAGKGSSKVFTAYYSARKPTLHLLAFAPSFDDNFNSQTLKYTDDDAKDIIDLFQTQEGKGIYSEIKVKSLINEEASATDINSAIERLKMQFRYKEINERDVVIVFASSHGFMENDNYYIKGNNYDPYSPTTTSVASTAMMQHLAEINCKKLLFIDACYSGGTSRDDTETRAINQTIEALTNQQKGIVTFTSSTGSQKSYEHDTWENGAFTYVITQALSGKADYNKDRKITINELNQYLQDNVPTLVRTQYNEIQTPQMFINGLDGDLPIFVY